MNTVWPETFDIALWFLKIRILGTLNPSADADSSTDIFVSAAVQKGAEGILFFLAMFFFTRVCVGLRIVVSNLGLFASDLGLFPSDLGFLRTS